MRFPTRYSFVCLIGFTASEHERDAMVAPVGKARVKVPPR